MRLAHELYAEIVGWTVGMHQLIVMGDLNETLTPHDRYPVPAPLRAASAVPSPIQCLVREGFTDTYRVLHPNPAHHPGFTHAIDSVTRSVRSRIDYIWAQRSFGASGASGCHAAEAARLCSSHAVDGASADNCASTSHV